MAEELSKAAATSTSMMNELGSSGGYKKGYSIKRDEFVRDLNGPKAIKKYREMRDNDAVIGAFMSAIDMTLRSAEWNVVESDAPGGDEAREFVEGIFEDMDNTFEDFISDVLSMLTYGFSIFEIVMKKRDGSNTDPSKSSRFDDGKIGISKLSPRAQWTIQDFDIDENGRFLGFTQIAEEKGYISVYIPEQKSLIFRTASANNDPSGRSILRNAYRSYYYTTVIQEFEAIAIERELNGLPVARVPQSYLAATSGDKKTFIATLQNHLSRVKRNEQGYLILPSDTYTDADGKPTSTRLVEFELVSSNGTRDIDTSKVISRYQQDMARSVLADFVMMGSSGSEKGSYALSKNKTDLFYNALIGYLNTISAVINRVLIPRLWAINGFDPETMPRIEPGSPAPANIEALGAFVQSLASSGAPLFPDEDLENVLRSSAGLPDRPSDFPGLDDAATLLGMGDETNNPKNRLPESGAVGDEPPDVITEDQ